MIVAAPRCHRCSVKAIIDLFVENSSRRNVMRKTLLPMMLVLLVAVPMASAHDPRTVAKDFSHSLLVEGAGKLTITYKSLHWNEPAYVGLKKNDQLRQRVVGSIWKKIGKLDTDFDVVIAGVKVPKGSYDFGLWFDANDNFKIV